MKPYHTVNVLHIPMKLGNVVNGVIEALEAKKGEMDSSREIVLMKV